MFDDLFENPSCLTSARPEIPLKVQKLFSFPKIRAFYGFGVFLRFSFISDLVRDKKCFENSKIISFKDVNPQAPFHALVVPKKHIQTLNHITEDYVNYKSINKVEGIDKIFLNEDSPFNIS